jgi:hypothetical protein
MQTNVIKVLVCFLAAVLMLRGEPAESMEFKNWTPVKPILLDLTLNISGKTHYAMRNGSKSTSDGATSESVENGAAYLAELGEGSAFGFVLLFDLGSTSRAYWDESTVTETLKQVGYWKSNEIRPSAAGDFTLHRLNLRWIVFPHVDAKGNRFACFGYSAAGRGARVALRGSWCAEGASSFSEAEIKGFVAAIGYKDVLPPTPLNTAPGLLIPG